MISARFQTLSSLSVLYIYIYATFIITRRHPIFLILYIGLQGISILRRRQKTVELLNAKEYIFVTFGDAYTYGVNESETVLCV